jgi:hypothetical protein
MTIAERTSVETVELDQPALRELIETVGGEVLGITSYDKLIDMYRAGAIKDAAGSVYLSSLLELAA